MPCASSARSILRRGWAVLLVGAGWAAMASRAKKSACGAKGRVEGSVVGGRCEEVVLWGRVVGGIVDCVFFTVKKGFFGRMSAELEYMDYMVFVV